MASPGALNGSNRAVDMHYSYGLIINNAGKTSQSTIQAKVNNILRYAMFGSRNVHLFSRYFTLFRAYRSEIKIIFTHDRKGRYFNSLLRPRSVSRKCIVYIGTVNGIYASETCNINPGSGPGPKQTNYVRVENIKSHKLS